MLKQFICPDGKCIDVDKCLDECRFKERCLPAPYLKAVSIRRNYFGKVSVTQGLNGTRYNYLNIKKETAEDPRDLAFATLGTNHHTLLEDHVDENGMNGFLGETDFYTGTFDYYDKTEQCLWDFKTYKAYKIKRVCGLSSKWIDCPSGEIYKRDGKTATGRVYKKGQVKQIEVPFQDVEKMDCENEAIQLNAYRIILNALGYEVKKMKLCMTCKDHNRRSVLDKIVTVELPFIDDDKIIKLYKKKTTELNKYIKLKKLPPLCSSKERWDGIRCEEYCPFYSECELELKPIDDLF